METTVTLERERRRRDLTDTMALTALDAVDAMVVITDTAGVIRYVNRAFTTATGYTPEEVLGDNPRVLNSGQHGQEFYAQMWRTVLDGGVWEGEVINRRKGGELYTDRMTISAVRDPDGEVSHFIAIKRDVSARVGDLLSASPYGVVHLGADGSLVYANERACVLLGRPFEELMGSGWQPSFTPHDARALELAVRATSRTGGVRAGDRVRVVTVGTRHLRVHLGALRPGDDTVLGCVLALEDVTAEVEATAALADRELFARTVLDTIESPTAVVDADGSIVHTNPAWRDGPPGDPLIGLAVGSNLLSLHPEPGTSGRDDPGLDPDHEPGLGPEAGTHDRAGTRETAHSAAQVIAAVREAVSVQGAKPRLVEHRSPGSRPRWWQVRVTHLPVLSGGAVISATDVTAMRRAQERSAVDAATDALTGVLNRRGLEEQLLTGPAHRPGPRAVLFIDLDRFKPVNDTYGHGIGDELLRSVASRLRQQIRDNDLLARMGGDEFVLVLTDIDAVAVQGAAERVAAALSEPFRLDRDLTVTIGASIGVATDDGDRDLESLMVEADAAMYAQKRRSIAAR